MTVRTLLADPDFQKIWTMISAGARPTLNRNLVTNGRRTFKARVELIRRLLRAGADPLKVLTSCRGPNGARFRQALQGMGASLRGNSDAENRLWNWTRLYYEKKGAARARYLAGIKQLLAAGASPNRIMSHGSHQRTVFHFAMLQADAEMVRLLLDHGADPKKWALIEDDSTSNGWAKSRNGLHEAVRGASRAIYRAGDNKAAVSTIWFGLVKRIIRSGMSPTAKDRYGRTALHHAATGSPHMVPFVELLLDRGGDPNIRTNKGLTVADWVLMGGASPESATMRLIRKAGGRATAKSRLKAMERQYYADRDDAQRRREASDRRRWERMQREDAAREERKRRRDAKNDAEMAALDARMAASERQYKNERRLAQQNQFQDALKKQNDDIERKHAITQEAIRNVERAQAMRAAAARDRQRAAAIREQRGQERARAEREARAATAERARQGERRRRQQIAEERRRQANKAGKQRIAAGVVSGGEGLNRQTTGAACASLRSAWGGGPSISYTPPAMQPGKVVRIRGRAKPFASVYEDQQQSCTASARVAADKLITETCRQKGGKWDGIPFRREGCYECKENANGNKWRCGGIASIGCKMPPKSNIELRMRKKLARALIDNAFPSVEGALTSWAEAKAGRSSGIPMGDIINIGINLQGFKKNAANFKSRIAKATGGLEVDSVAAEIRNAIKSLNRQISNCR